MNSLSQLLIGCLLFACAGVLPGQDSKPVTEGRESEGRIFGALVLARKVDGKKPETPDAGAAAEAKADPQAALKARLAKAFPDYNDFEVVGEHRQALFKQYETWVVPSRDLFLKIDSKGPAEEGGMKLHLQVWRDEQVILKTDPVLMPNRPLFIGGPLWRGGKLLIVVALDEE